MATFLIYVLKHQERKDGTFPVSIRVTNNRKSAYIKTGIYELGRLIFVKFLSLFFNMKKFFFSTLMLLPFAVMAQKALICINNK